MGKELIFSTTKLKGKELIFSTIQRVKELILDEGTDIFNSTKLKGKGTDIFNSSKLKGKELIFSTVQS